MRAQNDDPGFAAWCERMCVSRLRRRLAAGLPLSESGWRALRRLDPALRVAKNARHRMTPELVNETVDQAIDLNAAYDALATLLVRYYRTRLKPAVA